MNQQAILKLRKMQKQMMEAQKRLESTVFSGTAGGGMVEVEVYGNHAVKSVTIDPEAIETKEDVELVQDSIVAALNDANKKIDNEQEQLMGPLAGGMPGLF